MIPVKGKEQGLVGHELVTDTPSTSTGIAVTALRETPSPSAASLDLDITPSLHNASIVGDGRNDLCSPSNIANATPSESGLAPSPLQHSSCCKCAESAKKRKSLQRKHNRLQKQFGRLEEKYNELLCQQVGGSLHNF